MGRQMERLVFRVCRTVSSEMGRRWDKLKMKYLKYKTTTLLLVLFVNIPQLWVQEEQQLRI